MANATHCSMVTPSPWMRLLTRRTKSGWTRTQSILAVALSTLLTRSMGVVYRQTMAPRKHPWSSHSVRPIEERFLDNVEKSPSGCILWVGPKTTRDYGVLGVSLGHGKKRDVRAHRLAYELFVGPIPSGCEIDHLCRIHSCVSILHLEAVSHKVNVLRGTGVAAHCATKTHCKQGHPLSGPNLRTLKDGKRACRECGRISARKSWWGNHEDNLRKRAQRNESVRARQ